MSTTARVLSLASGVLPEFSPEQTASAAIAAGWDAVGIWVEPRHWAASTTHGVRQRVGDAGLRILDVEVVWLQPGPFDPDHLRVLDIGAELGAENALVVSSDPDMHATTEKLIRLVDHARGTGLRVALEFAAFTKIRALNDACAVLAHPDLEEATLLVDPLHFARTGGQPADLATLPASRFAYAQFCDAPAIGPHPDDADAIIHEAVDLRLMPGQGELPLTDLLRALPNMLPLSVELRSRALRDSFPEPADRARAVLRATRGFMQ